MRIPPKKICEKKKLERYEEKPKGSNVPLSPYLGCAGFPCPRWYVFLLPEVCASGIEMFTNPIDGTYNSLFLPAPNEGGSKFKQKEK